ncbi:MAG: hypothetical protein K8I30_16065, partial [Anaerolineae bacterium]|nr:hypothetical protein [Anaerolineae bacterium]
FIISDLLLRNVTAPNPTGRRYSSETPLTTGQGSSQEIGISGETVLARDLHLPNNNYSGQTQCICGRASHSNNGRCAACLVVLPTLSSYRMPDFVGPGFLAESKNEQGLLYTGREVQQIQDYVMAAILMKASLWVYVRVDTVVDPEFTQLVQSTGGSIVYYFAVPGYVDPVDAAAQKVMIVAIAVLGLVIVETLVVRRFKNRPGIVLSPAPKPPAAPKQPADPFARAARKTDDVEDFAQRAKDRKRRDIDVEDSRDDFV